MYYNAHTHIARANEIAVVNINLLEEHLSYPQYTSLSYHPWDIDTELSLEQLKAIFKQKIQNKNVVAIGECGLDKRRGLDLEIQKEYFKAQIDISETYQLPLITHLVKSYSESLAIRKQMNCRQAWVIHNFNSSEQTAKTLIKSGCYLSIGSRIIQDGHPLQKVLPLIDTHFLLLESDEETKEQNKNKNIALNYQKVAALLQITETELIAIQKQNFERIFKL